MPKVYLTGKDREREAERQADEEIVREIGGWLAVTGRNVGDLAAECGMSQSTFYSRMKRPGDFKLREYRTLRRIMEK